jgi:hypothetical protein
MVGGVFSQCLTATGNPAAENTENNARDGQNHENEENRLSLIEVQQLTHPGDHLGEELTDLRKQSSDNGSSSALKSSSFHKNIYGSCHGRNSRTIIEKTAAKIMK